MTMLSILRQIGAVTRVNILSIPRRMLMSISAVVSIAFVVLVLLGALALENGFSKTLEGSGADDVAIVMREGSMSEINSALSSEQQALIAAAPGIARVGGKPAVSNEFVVIVDGIKKSAGTKANLPFRGVNLGALGARRDLRIVEGRMFSPGSNEIVIGRGVLEAFDGFSLGQEKRLGANVWKVVGVFEASGSVFESEIWGDLPTMQSLFNRGDSVQSIRARLESPAAIERLKAYAAADPRLKVEIKSERDFYRGQSQGVGDLITWIGKPLALIMAIGALAGALNAMYASVANRATEIATLRTIGFGGIPTFVGTLLEALVLAGAGALLGAAAALLFFNGMTASTLGGSFTQVVFDLTLTPALVLEGVAWAVALGVLGGALPAWRAARQPILAAGE
jgi:putative ABC transport system permease protein